MAADPQTRYTALLRLLRERGDFALALSGGLDSRFLAHAAIAAGIPPALTLTATGAHMPAAEAETAARWARERDLAHTLVPVDVLAVPGVAANSRERCYGCKQALFSQLKSRADGRILVDGSHADDQKAFRPGLRALKELGVFSPLAEAGLSKADIRLLAVQTGLDHPDQPARPCLLTRLDYGMTPTVDLLARVAEAEAGISALGIADFRLRLPLGGSPVLQCSVSPAGHALQTLPNLLARHGFDNAVVLVEDSISGFFDRPHAAPEVRSQRVTP